MVSDYLRRAGRLFLSKEFWASRVLSIVAVCLSVSIGSARAQNESVVLLYDEGAGINPTTGMPNEWMFPDDSWQVGVTAAEVASFPEFSGSDAATQMVETLGADNQLIIANLTGTGESSASLGPVPAPGLSSGGLLFAQTINVPELRDGENNVTVLFPSFQLTAVEFAEDRVDVRLQAPMYILSNLRPDTPVFASEAYCPIHTEAFFGEAGFQERIQSPTPAVAPSVVYNEPQFIDSLSDVDVMFSYPIPAGGGTSEYKWESIMDITFEVVPEPSGLTLLGLGVLLGLARRRGR